VDQRRPLGTTEEVAAYVGVPKTTLYQWRLQAKGPRGIRIGRYLRYRWDDVEAWLDHEVARQSNNSA
jgi:excisionase family DNA binding protein